MIALLTPLMLLAAALPAQADLTAIGVDPFEPDKSLGPDDLSQNGDDHAAGALDATLLADGTLLVFPADAAGQGLAVRPMFRDATIQVIQDGRRFLVLWRAAAGADRPQADDRLAAVVIEGDRMQVFGLAELRSIGARKHGGAIVCYADDGGANDVDPGTDATDREVHRPGLPQ